MRHRRSSGGCRAGRRCLLRALAAGTLALGAARPLSAQGTATEGALFLLLPIGARAVGGGQAIVADEPGSEAVWWNPAAIARSSRAEAAIHHSQTIISNGDALTVVIPSSLLGVVAVGAAVVDFGRQEVTDSLGTVGAVLPRNLVYAVTYATPVGRRFSAGLSYKVVQLRVDCTGGCAGVPTVSASSSALDAGAQADLAGIAPVTVGLALRNAGPRLQVKDTDQADPLPTLLQAGVSYNVPNAERLARDVAIRVNADVLANLRSSGRSYRVGSTLAYRDRAFLRGGYVLARDEGEGDGPAYGIGLASGNIVFDIARVVRGLSVDSDKPPTYISLRYLF